MFQLLDEFSVCRQHRVVGPVGLADLQRCNGASHVLDQEDLEPVKVGTRSLEVVVVSDVFVGLLLLPAAVLEDERAGADHVLRAAVDVLLGQGSSDVLRVHLHVVRGQVDHERGCRKLDGHAHRPVVDHLRGLVFIEIAQAVGAAAERVGEGDPVQAVDDVAGRHRLPVRPPSVGEVEGVHRAVFADVPAFRQVADDLLRVNRVVFHQLVEPGTRRCQGRGQARSVVNVPEPRVVPGHPLHCSPVLALMDPVGFGCLDFHRFDRGRGIRRLGGTPGRRGRLGRRRGCSGLGLG